MGLLTLTQIPCHHVLANEISLNLKYRISLKHFFNINLGICIIKKLLFCSHFRHMSLCSCSNLDQGISLDAELNSASNEYPLGILLTDPATPKTRNTLKMWWWWWGSRVRQKYAEWVLVGCGINSASNEFSRSKFELKHREICRKYKQKQ